jgi:hypothetical protein
MLALAIMLGACSASAPSASPRASAVPSASAGGGTIPSDPCGLLSIADLKQATGVEFASGDKQTTGSTVECDWFQSGDAAGGGVIVVVSPAGQGHFDANKASGTAVTGIGDEAYWWGATDTLHIRTGGLELDVQVGTDKDPTKNATTAQALAKVVLAAL